MPELKLDAANNGSSANARIGDVIMISLPEAPTSGYNWVLDNPVQEILQLQKTEFGSDKGGTIGGTGVRYFTFLATQTGSAEISLKLLRPWVGDASIIERYKIFLHIQ
jgi:inhibitor of cysteine peptidase